MEHDPLQPVNSDTLRSRVTNSIRAAILQGILVPGGQINQAQIAAKLGISRGPLREALRQLEEEGLVESYPHKGTFVTEITPEYIEQLYSIRRVLETFAVKRMMHLKNPEILQELSDTVEAMLHAAESGDSQGLDALDFQFHNTIILGAQHSLLMQLWKSIEVGVRRLVAVRHGIYDDLYDIVGTHPDLLAAIKASDEPLATQLLDDHIREAGEKVFAAWSILPSRPPGNPVPASAKLLHVP